MKKFTLFVLSIGFVLSVSIISCSALSVSTNTDMHTAENALDYDGIYRGVLPCADCPGIKYTVFINRNGTFRSVMDYLERDTKVESAGNYTWDKAGRIITLKADKESPVKFFVGENSLTQLDADGERITGDLANNFILTKANYALLNKKWNLVEIFGKPVDASQTPKKVAFIEFNDQENRYFASAGCNSISGSFNILPLGRLKLGQGMSTMMACPDMTLEDQLSKVLQTADSFQINGDELILTKARMAPLARFKGASD